MAVPTDVNSPLTTPSHTAEHQRVFDALAALTPTWIALPFQNGWGNYGAGFELGSYCKVNNFVYLQGLVNSGTSTTLFTLPAGYRPGRVHLGVCFATTGAVRYDINPSGTFVLSIGTPTAGSTWCGLSGVVFSTTGLP